MAALCAASPRRMYLVLAVVTLLFCYGVINDVRRMGFSSSTRAATIYSRSGTIESLKPVAARDNSTSIKIMTNGASSSSSSPPALVSKTLSSHIIDDQARETVIGTAEAQATTSNDASCLMYLRIGKAGSSSLVKFFNDSLGMGQVSTLCYSNTGLSGLRKFSRETALDDANQVYQGHCGYGFDQYACLPISKETPTALVMQTKVRKEVPPTFCYYYTWLREPISRVISSFIYNNRNKLPANLTQYKKCFRDDTYCPMEMGPNWHNSMTYMLGSPRNEIYRERQPINVTREHLNKAKERLEHKFVAFGLLEYSKESLEMLQSILNVISTKKTTSQQQQHDDPEENKNTAMNQTLQHENARSAMDSFTARVRIELGEAIRQANLLDIELYAFARQLFLRRLEGICTTAISRYAKDWNTTAVQLHSCPFTASVPQKVAGDKSSINPIARANPQEPHVKGKLASAFPWPIVKKP